MASNNIKYCYFPFPGRSTATVLAFKIGGVEYEHEVVTDWPTRKPTLPTGAVPVIYIGDAGPYPQSSAILRYVGKLAGLYPEDPVAALAVDSIIDQVRETDNSFAAASSKDEDEKKRLREALVAPGGGVYDGFAGVENLVGDNGFAVGDSLTIADLQIYQNWSLVGSGFVDYVSTEPMAGKFPKIEKIIAKLEENDIVKAFAEAGVEQYAAFKAYIAQATAAAAAAAQAEADDSVAAE